jgi:hypothetical protein
MAIDLSKFGKPHVVLNRRRVSYAALIEEETTDSGKVLLVEIVCDGAVVHISYREEERSSAEELVKFLKTSMEVQNLLEDNLKAMP